MFFFLQCRINVKKEESCQHSAFSCQQEGKREKSREARKLVNVMMSKCDDEQIKKIARRWR